MTVSLYPAVASDLPLLRNLAAYYAYDLSEYLGAGCDADGQFSLGLELQTYLTTAGREAILLRSGEEPAGFVLLRTRHEEDDVDFSITDFFILRKFRRHHFGERVARELFDAHRGRWRVIEHEKNLPAVGFWRSVIGRYTSGQYAAAVRRSPWGVLNVLSFRNDGGPVTSQARPLLAEPRDPVRSGEVESYTWGPGGTGAHLVRTPQLSVIEVAMAGRTREARHRHGRAQQFFYVLSGTLSLEVEGRTHTLVPGTGLEVPATLAHHVINDADEPVRFLVVSQPPSHGDREPASH